MAIKGLTEKQKKADKDLAAILLITLVFFLIYTFFGRELTDFALNDNAPAAFRLMVPAVLQFGIAGCGIMAVCVKRKESFASHGLKRKNMLKATALTFLCFLPYIAYVFVSGGFEGYMPLSVLVTPEVLSWPFLPRLAGMAVIGVCWGFFEGFNYAVICDKVNDRWPFPCGNIDIGALVCSLFGIMMHPISLSFWVLLKWRLFFVYLERVLKSLPLLRKAFYYFPKYSFISDILALWCTWKGQRASQWPQPMQSEAFFSRFK